MSDYFSPDNITTKLATRDSAKLHKEIERITAENTAKILLEGTPAQPNLAYFTHIHKTLFAQIYDFAGTFRNVDIAHPANDTPFCYAKFLNNEARRIFDTLQNANYFANQERSEFLANFTEIAAGLNALHPFRDGNGRAIRLYLIMLADHCGYILDYSKVSFQTLLAADAAAFKGDTTKLLAVYETTVL